MSSLCRTHTCQLLFVYCACPEDASVQKYRQAHQCACLQQRRAIRPHKASITSCAGVVAGKEGKCASGTGPHVATLLKQTPIMHLHSPHYWAFMHEPCNNL